MSQKNINQNVFHGLKHVTLDEQSESRKFGCIFAKVLDQIVCQPVMTFKEVVKKQTSFHCTLILDG